MVLTRWLWIHSKFAVIVFGRSISQASQQKCSWVIGERYSHACYWLKELEMKKIFLCAFSLVLLASLSCGVLAQDIGTLQWDVNLSSAQNHLNKGLALISRGMGDDLYYAKQEFQFIVNMKDDHGLK